MDNVPQDYGTTGRRTNGSDKYRRRLAIRHALGQRVPRGANELITSLFLIFDLRADERPGEHSSLFTRQRCDQGSRCLCHRCTVQRIVFDALHTRAHHTREFGLPTAYACHPFNLRRRSAFSRLRRNRRVCPTSRPQGTPMNAPARKQTARATIAQSYANRRRSNSSRVPGSAVRPSRVRSSPDSSAASRRQRVSAFGNHF